MWLKDPKTGEKSVTVTILVGTVLVAALKLCVAGLTYKEFSFGAFTPTDYSVMLGAAGTLYWGRKHSDKDKE